jgi:hypothetical protein
MCHGFGACRAVQSATCQFAGICCRGTLYVARGLALPQDFSDESDDFRHFFLEKLGEPSSQRQLEGVALHAYAMRNAALRIACRVSMLCLAALSHRPSFSVYAVSGQILAMRARSIGRSLAASSRRRID